MPNFCPTCGAELKYPEAEICPACIANDVAQDQVGAPAFFLFILQLPLPVNQRLTFLTREPAVAGCEERIPLKSRPKRIIKVDAVRIGADELSQPVLGLLHLLGGRVGSIRLPVDCGQLS